VLNTTMLRVCCIWGRGCFVYLFIFWGGGLLHISSIYLVLILHAELIFGDLSEKIKNMYCIDVIFVYVYRGNYDYLYILNVFNTHWFFCCPIWKCFHEFLTDVAVFWFPGRWILCDVNVL
jgi:hypothetical protein